MNSEGLVMFNVFCRRRHTRRMSALLPVEALESRLLLSAVNVTSTPGPRGSVNLRFTGTAADDLVKIFLDNDLRVHVSGSSFMINGGNAQPDLYFDSVHSVTLNLGGGSDTGWIENVSIRNITINDGTTANETNRYTVISSSRDMRLNQVEANFNLGNAEFTLDSSRSIWMNNLAIRLQNTMSSKTIVQAVAGSTLDISGQFCIDASASSQSADYVLLQAFRNSPSDPVQLRLHGGMRLDLGGGNDVIQNAGATELGGPTLIDTGKGDDQINLAVGGNFPVSGDLVFSGRVSIQTGEGADFVSCASADINSDRVRFLCPVSISTGGQKDQLNLYKAVFYSSLDVDMGSNNQVGTDDVVLINDVQVVGLTRIHSAGRATVNVGSTSAATTRFARNAVFTLGSGSVTIGNGSQTIPQVIFDGAQIFAGIRSQITVKYSGLIQANLARRRLIRAVLE